jgi:hypothetical protein
MATPALPVSAARNLRDPPCVDVPGAAKVPPTHRGADSPGFAYGSMTIQPLRWSLAASRVGGHPAQNGDAFGLAAVDDRR